MATWTIQISAQTSVAHTASGTHATTLGEAQPADFDGGTINSVSVSGSPSTTVNVSDNDMLGVHFIIETSAGTDIYGTAGGGGGSNNDSTMCYAALNASSSTIVDGASTTPAPTTAVAADWDNVYWEVQYDAVQMQDATREISWSQFNVVVDYDPPPAPVLTLPTETNISQTKATVGCTTDSADGTLYWFVSTSATAPSASDLKNGVGAAHSSAYGNVTSPGVGTETFLVEELTPDTDYYTYFIHNNSNGDSNILESAAVTPLGAWSTNPIATGSESFDVSTDQVQNNTKDTNEIITYLNQLSESSTGVIPIIGTVAFDTSFAFLAQTTTGYATQANIDVVLDTADQVQSILNELSVFSFSLDLDKNIGGLAILDDPVYSAGNYIFVDLTNIALAPTGAITGTITFTNTLGQQESVLLVGQAAQQLLISLAQNQVATRVTSESETFTTLFDLGLSTAEFVTFIANIQADLLSSNQVDGLKSIFYNLALAKKLHLEI
jgi:hypothetical protein